MVLGQRLLRELPTRASLSQLQLEITEMMVHSLVYLFPCPDAFHGANNRTGSSGASGASVLAIASAEAATWPAAPFWLTYHGPNGENKTDMNGYNWYRDQWDIKDWPIVPFSLNTTEDNQACLPLPAGEYPDWSKKIVLVRRGGCDFKVQEMNLRAAYKSIYVMYYNNDESPITPWTDNYEWPKALVDKAVGEAIIETIKTGGSVTADFTPNPDYNFQTGIFSSLGNRPNQFTSWGGLYNMDSKPDLAAPGGDILSTFIYNSWRVMSGTSQACPYVAGVAALYSRCSRTIILSVKA